jgi:hypothetical protein
VIDFAIAVRAPFAYPIHDFVISDTYQGILRNVLGSIVERFGVQYRTFAEPVSVSV